jgi:polyisoprenoid-binding protein YceI
MNTRFSLAVVASLALAGAALAQGAPPAVQSGTYTLEPVHAMVMFGVSHFGYSNYYGQFPGATGTLVLDGAHPAESHLDVSVPVAGVWTPSAKLAEELKSADWLDAAAFPAMTFHSKRITVTGPTSADVAGDLTIHGVTQPVTLTATFKRAGEFPMNKRYMVGFDARGFVKRSLFGVSKYVQFGLGDNVEVIISAPFERKAS